MRRLARRIGSLSTVALLVRTCPVFAQQAPSASEQQLAPLHVTPGARLDSERVAPPEEPRRVTPPAPRLPLPRNVITWQPLSLIFASWDLEYERVIIPHLSLYLAGSIVFGHNEPYTGPQDLWVYGGAGDIGGRVYPFGRAPSGFFLQAYVGLTSFFDDYTGRVRGLGWRVGLMPGYSILVARVLSFSFGTGFEYLSFDEGGYVRSQPSFTLRTAIGPAF